MASCGGGGSGGGNGGGAVEQNLNPPQPEFTVQGSFIASKVKGLEVCEADTNNCVFTDGEGKFAIKANSEKPLLYFYITSLEGEKLKVGEYRVNQDGEAITPFKLTSTTQGGALLAKTIHAIAGDTSGAPKISLSHIESLNIEGEEIDSLAKALDKEREIALTACFGAEDCYRVKVEPQEQKVEVCTRESIPGGEEKCQEVNYKEWLVLIYMDGDNDLSTYVDKDIEELSKVELSPLVKVVVLADYRGRDGGKIFESDEKTGKLVEKEVVEEPDMGSKETFKEFLKENMDKYPAQKRALILWDHGDGWRSLRFASFDENPDSLLFMYRFYDALKELQKEGYSLNLIGFDECLMGMAEVFYEAGQFADAVVASQTYEPGEGWNYTKVMEKLNRDPIAADPYQLGKIIVDAYREAYGSEPDVVLTLLSKGEIERLTEEINSLAGELSEKTYQEFKRARETASEIPDTSYIDLYSFVKKLPFESAKAIKELIEKAYSFSSSPKNYRGISIYFPRDDRDENLPCYLKEEADGSLYCYNDPNYYNPFAINQWDEFLEKYYSMEEK